MQRFRYVWPALLWALAIFLFSTALFSASNTGRFLIPILHFLLPSAPMAWLEHLHLVIRKFGHIAEYFVLCLLVFRVLRRDHDGWMLQWALWAVLIASVYAGTDEFHQIFVPGRTAEIQDVMIDTCGAIFAQCCLFVWSLRSSRANAPLAGD
jgi:VanZ family protein